LLGHAWPLRSLCAEQDAKGNRQIAYGSGFGQRPSSKPRCEGVTAMDFIERLFGISPDGGDGSVEMMIFGGVVLLAVLLAWRWRSKHLTPNM
jgi:hypothetical protein